MGRENYCNFRKIPKEQLYHICGASQLHLLDVMKAICTNWVICWPDSLHLTLLPPAWRNYNSIQLEYATFHSLVDYLVDDEKFMSEM